MAIRISFTIDPEMMDLIDKFAKEHGIDRNHAILDLIESGFSHIGGDHPTALNQRWAFEEYQELKATMDKMRESLENLAGEVQLIHHIIDVEWGREMRPVPYQSRRWWEFWKTP